MDNKNKGIIATLIFLMFLLFPQLALASNIFEPVAGDKSLLILSALFGGLGVFGPSGADAFSGVIGVLNGAALTIGGILVSYTIISGTLGTAHDGEMLGKKFSSVWVPIRTALGTALVMPVVGGAYCVMQVMVGWLIVQGIGLADNVWIKYITSSNLSVASSVGLPRPEATTLGYTAFQSFVCLEAMKVAVSNPNTQLLNSGSNFGISIDESTLTKTYQFGDMAERGGFKKDSCGSIQVSKYQIPTMGPATGGVIAPLFNAVESAKRMKSIINEHDVQLGTLMNGLHTLATTMVATKQPIDPIAIDNLVVNYESGVKAKTASVIASMDEFKEISDNASKDGFILAGAYFMKMSSFTDMIHRSVSNVPSSNGPKGDINNTYMDSYLDAIAPMIKTISKSKSENAVFAIGNMKGGSNESFADTFKSFLSDGLDLNIVIKKLFISGLSFSINDGEHPVMAMKRLGDNLLNLAGISLLGKGLVAMGTLGNFPGIGLMLQTSILLFAPPILIAGVLLSYVLPMMPFMIWMGVIIAWIILCVEALIAAPIWAVMHLHPSGDDMTGKGGNGYNLVLSLLLRPMLMVFGLIAALTILNVFGQFYNRIFADVFASSQQDSNLWIWLIGILMSAFIYSFGMWIIIKRTFSIIHEIPDHMLEWFGQSSHSLGKSAQEVGGTGAYLAGAQIAGNMTNAGMNALNKSMEGSKALSMDDKKSAVNLDKDFGSGTSEMFNKMNDTSNNEGLSSLETVQKKGMMSEAIGMLGGSNSEHGSSFMERMKQSVESNPGQSFNEHLNGALSKGLNDLYGENTLQTAMKVGFGADVDSKENTGGKLLNPEFKRAISMYRSVSKALQSRGMGQDEIKESISNFNSNVENSFNNNKDSAKEYKHIFSNELKSFRK